MQSKTSQIRYIVAILSLVLVTEVVLALRPVRLNWIGIGMYLFCAGSLIWIVARQNGAKARAQSAADVAERRLRELLKEMADRKRAEMAESRANILLDTLFESAPVGLGFLDPDLRFVRVNRTLAALNRMPVTEHIGRAWLDVWPQIPSQLEEALLSVITTGHPIVNLEIEGFADAEKRFPLAWNVSCYPIQLGSEVAGVGAVCEEVTERKRREEALRKNQKMESLGILAGGVAHDFNNILTAILGHASLLASRLPPHSPEFRSARVIVQSSERAAELTKQMLAYAGRGRFALVQLDLGREITASRSLLEASLPRRIHLEFDIPLDLPLVEADPSQVHQLVLNLVSNAYEAMDAKYGQLHHEVNLALAVENISIAPPGRASTSSHLEPGRYVVLCVRDEGLGMDEDTQARIFDPFFSTKFTGRGLGLSAALGIVRAYGGAIHVQSQPGRGSQFKVYFPIAESSATQESATPQARALLEQPGATPTILVVDDETGVLEITRMVFEARGFRVLLAANAHEAIRLFQSHSEIGVVLLDMTMPEVDGGETLRQLRSIRDSVVIVGSSGLSESEARESFGEGLGGFLQKPYTPRVLMAAIESALSTSTRAHSA